MLFIKKIMTEFNYDESFNESDDELLATTDFDGKFPTVLQ